MILRNGQKYLGIFNRLFFQHSFKKYISLFEYLYTLYIILIIQPSCAAQQAVADAFFIFFTLQRGIKKPALKYQNFRAGNNY
ncbi:hypothetical protein M23134_05046 [Microscilla marina ATCC 23134]|uniref:Uncharacterized protein n=1 Tax=Microscilla marina ATCC 23134 TaxID=313606 RepID=A1ZD01_MICM2|nr:hypothetical protein M23134_05046 [Microscilla marina ATCC 23134]